MNNDERIRQIVREEMRNQTSNNRFGLNTNNSHRHTGLDSPKINSVDLIPGLKTSGSVTMSSTKDYKFNVNFTPSLVFFYGTVADNVSGTGYRSLTIGQAALGQNLYFQPQIQPQSSSSVVIGGKFGIVQSCSSLVNTGANHYAPIGEGHIIDVWTTDSSSPQARATVTSYGQNFFIITVETLAANTSIVGNFFVS